MKRHVLIVDDNMSDITKVSTIIENDGLIPIIAKDPHSAIEISRTHRLDLAVVDIHMPKMNGFKLTELLKAQPDSKALPILMMSGSYKAEADVRAALLAGASDFMLKPIDPILMSSKVAQLLTNKAQWGEWSLVDSGIDARGDLGIQIEVLSISEMGIRILSSVPLKVKSSPLLNIPLLQHLGIPHQNLDVVECTRLPTKEYSSYLTFVGMPEAYLQKIRIFCRKLSSNRKNG